MNTNATGILQTITPEQVKSYCPDATNEQSRRVAREYNNTWAGTSWTMGNGEIAYTKP